MSIGLIGKKAGMSRLFQEDGTSIPVTVVSVAGNFVTDIKTSDRDGYSSVVISKQFFKKKKLKKSQAEYFKKHNVNPGNLHEFRTSSVDDLKVGLPVSYTHLTLPTNLCV